MDAGSGCYLMTNGDDSVVTVLACNVEVCRDFRGFKVVAPCLDLNECRPSSLAPPQPYQSIWATVRAV